MELFIAADNILDEKYSLGNDINALEEDIITLLLLSISPAALHCILILNKSF
jgi:hypothetical protein